MQQSISVKLIYQFLYLINGYLFFRCLEKVFEEEKNENKVVIVKEIEKEIVKVLNNPLTVKVGQEIKRSE